MKKLLILLFSIIFSPTTFAGWTWITDSTNGTEYYIDYESIKNNDGYHYFYFMMNLLEPDKDGDLSYALYFKVDCKSSQFKNLSEYYYKNKMGEGNLTTNNIKNPDWEYPPPGSMTQTMQDELCNYVK